MYVEECAAGSGRSSDSFTLSRVVVGTTIVQIDRRASRERWRTRSVEEGTRRSSPRPTGRVEQSGPTVGLCRKKTKSRGVNIIRAREGHRPPWTPAKYNRHALTTFRLFFFFSSSLPVFPRRLRNVKRGVLVTFPPLSSGTPLLSPQLLQRSWFSTVVRSFLRAASSPEGILPHEEHVV